MRAKVAQSGYRLCYELDDRSLNPGGSSDGILIFTTASITVLGPTQPPKQWAPGALTAGVRQLGREADHPPPTMGTTSWRGVQLRTGATLAFYLLPNGQEAG